MAACVSVLPKEQKIKKNKNDDQDLVNTQLSINVSCISIKIRTDLLENTKTHYQESLRDVMAIDRIKGFLSVPRRRLTSSLLQMAGASVSASEGV